MTSALPVEQAAPTGAWRTASVGSVGHPSPHAVVLRLHVPERIDHLPGQHYVIRLVAEDGYVAQRSYSIVSAPSDPLLEFYVDRLPDGEVSTFLADVVEPGDELQVRGPIGGWFVWRGDRPAVGIGGGSGAAPLVSMVRHARDLGRAGLLQVVVAARTLDDVPYADELIAAGAHVALSRADLAGRPGARLGAADLQPLAAGAGVAYVCGSAGFCAAAEDLLQGLTVPVPDVRVERFGPTA